MARYFVASVIIQDTSQIADGVIVDADVNAAANISSDKLDLQDITQNVRPSPGGTRKLGTSTRTWITLWADEIQGPARALIMAGI